jgi:hypothetical protein
MKSKKEKLKRKSKKQKTKSKGSWARFGPSFLF